MLNMAFKEWAAVCEALASGRQTVILRKGGIAEENGLFRPDHDRFWLYPTYVHQQESGLKPGSESLLTQALAKKPSAGTLSLSHIVEVTTVCHLSTLEMALAFEDFHILSADTIRMRFAYRTPGLFLLHVRVASVDAPRVVPERPEYAGCKTWVELADPVDDHPATPVLDDAAWAADVARLSTILGIDG